MRATVHSARRVSLHNPYKPAFTLVFFGGAHPYRSLSGHAGALPLSCSRSGRVTFSNFLGHSTAPIQFEVEGAFALYFWPTYFFLGCFFSSEVVVSPEFSMFYGIVYRNQVISTL